MKLLFFFLFFLNYDVKIVDVPKAIEYHTKMADFYYHKGNYPEMLYHLTRKIHYDKNDVSTWSDLSYYYWSMSVDDKIRREEFKSKAIKYLLEGLEFNKNTAYLWDEIGRYYINTKEFDTATKYFLEAIKRKDCQDVTYHFLALCFYKNNDLNKAIDTMESCVKRFPRDEKAKANLKKYKNLLSGS